MSELLSAEEQVRAYIASLGNDSEKLISERTIASKFSLNRSNSRKLLMSLEGQGFLECIPQKGYRRVDYSNTTNRTFYTIRTAIESEAARLACDRATREDILRMMLILEEADECVAHSDINRFPHLDYEFHRALLAASHDNLLLKLYGLLYIPSARKKPWNSGTLEQTHLAHQTIFSTVRNHDQTAAVDAVRAHIGKQNNEEIFQPKP